MTFAAVKKYEELRTADKYIWTGKTNIRRSACMFNSSLIALLEHLTIGLYSNLAEKFNFVHKPWSNFEKIMISPIKVYSFLFPFNNGSKWQIKQKVVLTVGNTNCS